MMGDKIIYISVAGAPGIVDPSLDINFTGANQQINGVQIATVDDLQPFDTAANYDTTGAWSYSINGIVQQLMTDDPTFNTMTYVFAVTDNGLIAPDIVYDARYTDLPNLNGYESSRNKITGDLSSKIMSKTAEISTSHNAVLVDSIAKVQANGKGLTVTDTGTGTSVALTADLGATLNNEAIVTIGSTTKTTLVDTDQTVLSDGVFKSFTWLNAYNYIKSKLSTAGLVYLTRDTLSNIETNFPAANYANCVAVATDLNNAEVLCDGIAWRVKGSVSVALKSWSLAPYINLGGQTSAAAAISYSQALTTVTVNHASHGMTADFNGGEIYLTQGTGALLSGWFTGWTYIDANSYSCTSIYSQTASGNLGTNTSETMLPFSYTSPSGLIAAAASFGLVFVRKVNTLGTKTLRTYFNGILNEATAYSPGSAITWGNTNSAANTFTSATKYYANGVSADLITLSAPTYTASVQCSLATTWIAVQPSYLTYTNRG